MCTQVLHFLIALIYFLMNLEGNYCGLFVLQSSIVVCEFNHHLSFLHTEFVKSDRPKNFPGLEVRYKKGANPTLKLLDETRTVQDTLA